MRRDLEEILYALKTLGYEPIFEQNKKIHLDELVTQERIKIDLSGTNIDELTIHQISNFCKSFNFKCSVICFGDGMNKRIQAQFFEKKEEENEQKRV